MQELPTMPVIRRLRRGFTLIELLVVLAIVAVLLTLAVPRYLQQVDRSKEAVLLDNLQTTRRVIDRFYGDKGRYPESLDELVESRYLRGLPYDPVLESSHGWQLLPVPEGYEGTVYDLRSTAPGNGADGRPYADW